MSIYQLEHDGDARELGRLLADSDSPAVRARAAEALGAVSEADEGVVDALVRTAVDDDGAGVRAAAIDALDGIGGDAIQRLFVRAGDVEIGEGDELPVDVLVDALSDDTPELRMAAANAVGHDEITEAVPALVERLDDPDPRVRLRVVRAAGQVGDPRAVDPLSALSTGEPTKLRQEVATALGDIGGERALEALDPLLDDRELAVRRDAVAALGRFDRRRPVGRLVEQFEDEDDEIGRAAAFAIVDLLSNAPAGDSHELRSEVVDALAASPAGTVVDALVEVFEESTEAHRRRNAAWLLGRVSDGDRGATAIETLVAALGDDDETVRRFAATSLAAIDAPGVEEALLDALEDTYGEGREMVLFVLGKVGSERARRRLLELLDEVEDLDVQERTLAALSRLGGI